MELNTIIITFGENQQKIFQINRQKIVDFLFLTFMVILLMLPKLFLTFLSLELSLAFFFWVYFFQLGWYLSNRFTITKLCLSIVYYVSILLLLNHSHFFGIEILVITIIIQASSFDDKLNDNLSNIMHCLLILLLLNGSFLINFYETVNYSVLGIKPLMLVINQT